MTHSGRVAVLAFVFAWIIIGIIAAITLIFSSELLQHFSRGPLARLAAGAFLVMAVLWFVIEFSYGGGDPNR